MHLLDALKNDDSSLFAKEIVVQPVVGPMLLALMVFGLHSALASSHALIEKALKVAACCRTNILILSQTRLADISIV